MLQVYKSLLHAASVFLVSFPKLILGLAISHIIKQQQLLLGKGQCWQLGTQAKGHFLSWVLLDDHLEQQQQTLENHSKPFIDEAALFSITGMFSKRLRLTFSCTYYRHKSFGIFSTWSTFYCTTMLLRDAVFSYLFVVKTLQNLSRYLKNSG